MIHSQILAQWLGIFFAVMGLGFVLNREHIHKVFKAIIGNHAIQLIATIIPLLLGSYLVVVHNYWVAGWPVIITVVGWLIMFAGIFRSLCPGIWIDRVKEFHKNVPVAFVGAVILILGVVLLYFGFFHK